MADVSQNLIKPGGTSGIEQLPLVQILLGEWWAIDDDPPDATATAVPPPAGTVTLRNHFAAGAGHTIFHQDYTWQADEAGPEISTHCVGQVGGDGSSLTVWLWSNLFPGPAVLSGTLAAGGYEASGKPQGGGTVTLLLTLTQKKLGHHAFDIAFSYAPPATVVGTLSKGGGPQSTQTSALKSKSNIASN